MSEFTFSEEGNRKFIYRDEIDNDLDLQLDSNGELYVRNPFGGWAHALRVIATRKLGRELKWAEVVLQRNHDPMDVRRRNLKVVLLRERHKGSKSKIKICPKKEKPRRRGVVWDEQEGRWLVDIQLLKQKRFRKHYNTEVEAADARADVLTRFRVK